MTTTLCFHRHSVQLNELVCKCPANQMEVAERYRPQCEICGLREASSGAVADGNDIHARWCEVCARGHRHGFCVDMVQVQLWSSTSGPATSTHLDSASASHRTPVTTLPHQSELHGGSVAVPQSVQMQALSTRHGLSPAMDRGQVQIHAIRSMSRVYTSAVHRTPATSLRHQSELHGDSVAADHNSVQMQVRGLGGRHSPFDMASPPVARGGPGRV